MKKKNIVVASGFILLVVVAVLFWYFFNKGGISVTSELKYLNVGNSSKIYTNYKSSDLTFKSSDEKIATIDNEGKIYAVSTGDLKVTITTKDGKNSTVILLKIINNVNWTIDYSKYNKAMCTQTTVTLYEDNKYIYQVANDCYANDVYVVYSNGEKYTVKQAVNTRKVTISGLEKAGYEINKIGKKIKWTIDYNKYKKMMCTQSIATLYEDNKYVYQVANDCYANNVYIVYSDGKKYTVKQAVTKGKITISELEAAGYEVYKIEKKITWTINYIEYGKMSCTQSITTLYEDNKYIYQVANDCYANNVYVVYSNGEKYTVKQAVNAGKVTILELISKGYNVYKTEKNPTWTINYDEYKKISCTQSIETLSEDNKYIYQVPNSCYADSVYIIYSNGEKYTVKQAVIKGKVTISELISKGYQIYKTEKKPTWTIDYSKYNKMSCTQSITTLYEDSKYIYRVSNSCYADSVYIVYSNGNRYTVKQAVSTGKVTISELITKGYQISKAEKKPTWTINYDQYRGASCTDEIAILYTDNNYIYQVSNDCYASLVYIVYSNGTRYTVKQAVSTGKVTISELISKGYQIYKKNK